MHLEKIIKSEKNSDIVFDKFVTNTFKMRQFEVAIMEKLTSEDLFVWKRFYGNNLCPFHLPPLFASLITCPSRSEFFYLE